MIFNNLSLIFSNVWSQATDSTAIKHSNMTITRQSSFSMTHNATLDTEIRNYIFTHTQHFAL
jgi:hypothetical protein